MPRRASLHAVVWGVEVRACVTGRPIAAALSSFAGPAPAAPVANGAPPSHALEGAIDAAAAERERAWALQAWSIDGCDDNWAIGAAAASLAAPAAPLETSGSAGVTDENDEHEDEDDDGSCHPLGAEGDVTGEESDSWSDGMSSAQGEARRPRGGGVMRTALLSPHSVGSASGKCYACPVRRLACGCVLKRSVEYVRVCGMLHQWSQFGAIRAMSVHLRLLPAWHSIAI